MTKGERERQIEEEKLFNWVGPLQVPEIQATKKIDWGIGGSFQPANSVSHFSVIEYAQPPGQG